MSKTGAICLESWCHKRTLQDEIVLGKTGHMAALHWCAWRQDDCGYWGRMVKAIYSLRPRQNGRNFADDTFKHIFLNQNVRISIKISLKFVPKSPINYIPALVQIMAWRRPGDKPLSEPMMVRLPTHIWVTRPQWVNSLAPREFDLSLKLVDFKLISTINILIIFSETAIRRMPQ